MIEVKNSQLDDQTIEALNELVEKDVNPQAALSLLKIIKELDFLITEKQKAHNSIVKLYGKPSTEDSNIIEVQKEDVEAFKNEIRELMEIKHELNYDKLNYNQLNLTDNIKIKTLAKLEFIFDGL